ncbi:putative ABC transporter ATP-binding protein AlbC [compost metagenome]
MGDFQAPALNISALSKKYGSNLALSELYLSVYPKQIYGLLGENGAGKTTTLQIISGVIEKTSGLVEIEGISLEHFPIEAKKKMFFIPDHAALFEKMRGDRYLKWMCQIYDTDYGQAWAKIKDLTESFGLIKHIHKEIGEMSLGNKQKLLLAAGLMIDPALLILDEPMVGLDPRSIIVMKEALQLFSQSGGAVLFSTHLLHIAQEICSHVIILKEGKTALNIAIESLPNLMDLENTFTNVVSR